MRIQILILGFKGLIPVDTPLIQTLKGVLIRFDCKDITLKITAQVCNHWLPLVSVLKGKEKLKLNLLIQLLSPYGVNILNQKLLVVAR